VSRLFPSRHEPVDYLMVLRGSAAIGVVLSHLLSIGALSIGAIVTNGQYMYVPHAMPFETWQSVLEILTPIVGENFVILFFVQSGYLMGKVFFDGRYDANNDKRAFYWARYLRLAPLLYFTLIICIGLYRFADLSPLKMAGDFLFITNFTGRGINLVTWSLSHEMQYYLIAPFVFLAFRRAGRKALVGVIVLVIFTFLIGTYIPPFAFVYAFLAGFAVNLIQKRSTSVRVKRLGLVLGLLVLHLGFNVLHFINFPDLARALTVLIAAWLVNLCERPAEEEAAPMILRVCVLTGFLTYGIYLWHYVIIMTRASDFADLARETAAAVGFGFWATVALFHTMELVVVLIGSYLLAYTTFILIEARFRPTLYSGISKK
jgi:peptidoglycan/LPS O-acetylase OafA/YrhL